MQLILRLDGDSDDAAAQFHEDFRICKFLPILFRHLRRQGIKIFFTKTADDKGSGDDVIVLQFAIQLEADELAFFMADNGNRVVIGINGFDIPAAESSGPQ
jgi:hypothetical protein